MEERSEAQLEMEQYVALLKSRIPPEDQGALESRLEELLNDPTADENDAITILRQEFDPSYEA